MPECPWKHLIYNLSSWIQIWSYFFEDETMQAQYNVYAPKLRTFWYVSCFLLTFILGTSVVCLHVSLSCISCCLLCHLYQVRKLFFIHLTRTLFNIYWCPFYQKVWYMLAKCTLQKCLLVRLLPVSCFIYYDSYLPFDTMPALIGASVVSVSLRGYVSLETPTLRHWS